TDAHKPKQPKVLYFPAGVYIINAETALPLFEGTCWIGDGSGRTIIYLMNSNARAVVETADWSAGTVYRNVDIGVYTEKPVQNINISGITLARSSVDDIMRLDRANTGLFLDVEFVVADLVNGKLEKNNDWDTSSSMSGITNGGWPLSTRYKANEHGICVRIDRMSSLNPIVDNWYSGDFNFIDCQFKSNTYGFYMVDAIDNVKISSSMFDGLFKGVSLGEAIYYTPSELNNIGDFAWSLPFDKDLGETYLNWNPNTLPWGPSAICVTHSMFKNIFDVPFSVFSNKPGNISANNMYMRYGGSLLTPPDNEAIYFLEKH
ncbi:MAG: hypothetical protein HC836_43070, partial [Richelia sp. RM2_1_2]|nr:hypothetical protein [Richelia sp. RM2_1_2]